MSVKKDAKTGKWIVQYRYTDWLGKRRKSTKRGFSTKREADEWLRNFLAVKQADLDMLFEDFLKIYYSDMESRIRETTLRTKRYIMELKVLPYFGKRKMNEISPADIRKWQNELMKQGYAPTYLKTIHNQLNAVFNFAVRYYDLQKNPCTKAGSMGKAKADEMQFWTMQEFMQFADAVMDKQQSYMAFMVLYWTGMRVGELLALTRQDIDLEALTISINKSYQRIDDRDVITPPKTPKSKRVVVIPDFLANDLQAYFNRLYGLKENDRIFPFTKYFMGKEMERGCKISGVKKIRVHDLRHSHCAHLIEKGFTPLAIAERLGHDRVETTMNTYAHLYPNKQKQIADSLQADYQVDLL